MSVGPLQTVTSLLLEALGHDRGSPSWLYGPVRRGLDPADLALFGPLLGDKTGGLIPDCLVPRPRSFAPDFGDELERVASTCPERLVGDLAADGLLDSAWSLAARAPRKWIDAYAACLGRVWTSVRPLWDRAQPLLEREVDRVGSALARGTLDALLRELSPRVHVVKGRWFIEGHPDPVTFAPGLVLTPVVCGSRALIVVGSEGIVRELAYPLSGTRRLGDLRTCPTNGDALEALLGGPRAELLRRLDRSVTVGSLAESMLYGPSAISHHLVALERAGLVQRERRGRHVLVHRTARGTGVVNLYDH